MTQAHEDGVSILLLAMLLFCINLSHTFKRRPRSIAKEKYPDARAEFLFFSD